jgi:MFS family permease
LGQVLTFKQLEQVKGHSALLTSAQTSPVAVTGVLFAISTVFLVHRIGVSWVMLIAMCFFMAGSLLLALLPLNQMYWLQTFISIVIMPGAMNLSFPAATILLSNALPKEKQGIAASLVATVLNYCIASGLGLAGTIHRHSLERAFSRHGHSEFHPPTAEDPHPPPPPSISFSSPELRNIRIEAMRGPWWFAVGLSGIGVMLASLFILRNKRKTENI